MNDYKYIIIPTADLSGVDFACVRESGPDTVRRSIDGLETFVSYLGNKPRCLYGLEVKDHTAIMAYLKTNSANWEQPDPSEI